MQRRNIFLAIIGTVSILVFYFQLCTNCGKKNSEKVQFSDEIFEKQCYHGSFKRVLLVLNFNFPYYDNIPLLKDLYEGVFEKVVFCGPSSQLTFKIKPDLHMEEQFGHRGYKCMALAMQNYPGYEGYMFGNDDMVINWWTMVNEDRSKIWHGTQIVDWRQRAFGPIVEKRWIWWTTDMGLEACQKYYKMLKILSQNYSSTNEINYQKILDTYLINSKNEPRCGKGWSDFFYVPGKLIKQFIELSSIAFKFNLFHEIAVHNVLISLDSAQNIRVLNGLYLPDLGDMDYKADVFWKAYNHHIAFVHPYKFHGPDRHTSLQKFKSEILKFKDKLIAC